LDGSNVRVHKAEKASFFPIFAGSSVNCEIREIVRMLQNFTTMRLSEEKKERQTDLIHSINASQESSASFSLADEEYPKEENGLQIAKKESRTVLRLRLVVVLVLVSSIILVAVAAHAFTVESETTRFHDQFENDALKVMEAVGSTFDKSMGAFDALAVTLVSYAQASNQSWPFVTLPNYGMHVAKILPVSKAIYIFVNPLVTPENRRDWESYALNNQHWVNETMYLQEHWSGYNGPVIYNWTAEEEIFSDFSNLCGIYQDIDLDVKISDSLQSQVRFSFCQSRFYFVNYL
jgi:hypothetical protein